MTPGTPVKLPLSFKIFIGCVAVVVIAVVGYGLTLAGAPVSQRAKQLDTQRVTMLAQIVNTINGFWSARQRLPTSLVELSNLSTNGTVRYVDPVTDQWYEYRVLSSKTYELCGTFDSDTTQQAVTSQNPFDQTGFVHHGKGRFCMDNSVKIVSQ